MINSNRFVPQITFNNYSDFSYCIIPKITLLLDQMTLDSLNINTGSAIPLIAKLRVKNGDLNPARLSGQKETFQEKINSVGEKTQGIDPTSQSTRLIKPIESNSTTPDAYLFSDQMHAQPPIFADPTFLNTEKYHPVSEMISESYNPMVISERGFYITPGTVDKQSTQKFISEKSVIDEEKIRRRYSTALNRTRGKLVDLSG